MTGITDRFDFSLGLTQEDYQFALMRAAVNNGVVLPPQVLRLEAAYTAGGVTSAATARCGLAIIVLAAAMACAGETPPSPPAEAEVAIPIGSSVRLPGTDILVRFEQVLNDSRCPADVQCITAGDATVVIAAATGAGAARHYELHTTDGAREVTHDAVRMRVADLAPVPQSTRAIPSDAYRLTLHISPV